MLVRKTMEVSSMIIKILIFEHNYTRKPLIEEEKEIK